MNSKDLNRVLEIIETLTKACKDAGEVITALSHDIKELKERSEKLEERVRQLERK